MRENEWAAARAAEQLSSTVGRRGFIVSECSVGRIPVLNPDQSTSEATVHWWYLEESCNVDISFQGHAFHGSSTDFLAALAEARRSFERNGHRLLCYGASRNAWASGMAREMGLGLKVYQLTLGKPAGDVMQSAFDTGPDVVPATVAEQESFYQEWLESNSSPRRPTTR
jgi:hypothetical protein